MNKKIPSIPAIGIISLIALLVGTVVVLIGLQIKNSIKITLFGEAQEKTADWKTYRDEEYGLEFKYPSLYALDKEEDIQKWILSGQPIAKFNYKDINLLYVAVFNNSFDNYRLIDQVGGVGFYFDTEKKEWFNLEGGTSGSLPQKMETSVEAYIYKSGDINCGWDWIIIPHPSYSYVVEILNNTCRQSPDYKEPDFILDSDHFISTFSFIEEEENIDISDWKTYIDSKQGFSIQYPLDWHVIENLRNDSISFCIESDNDCRVNAVNVYVYTLGGSKEILDYWRNQGELLKEINITIDGLPAIKREESYCMGTPLLTSGVFVKGDYYDYQIQGPYTQCGYQKDMEITYNSAKNIFSKMLSTFKFID